MTAEALTREEIEAMELGQVPPGASGDYPVVEMRSAATLNGVDFGERIITVLAMPYESPAPVMFQRAVWNEVFSRSAFHGFDPAKRRVPATACLKVPAPDHAGGQIVGRVIKTYPENQEGFVADLKISETSIGEDVLKLAKDDALSISVGFMMKNRLDETLDRNTQTRRINRAFLDHIALVGQPAYGGTKVMAMRAEGTPDPNPSATPGIDDFQNDPIFQFFNDRMNR